MVRSWSFGPFHQARVCKAIAITDPNTNEPINLSQNRGPGHSKQHHADDEDEEEPGPCAFRSLHWDVPPFVVVFVCGTLLLVITDTRLSLRNSTLKWCNSDTMTTVS